MDMSIFPDKSIAPSADDLRNALGDTFNLWNNISDYVVEKYKEAREEWHFGGQKYGWSFRIKDKKRVIVYLLPRDRFFKIAMVFGDKAYDSVLKSTVATSIKEELSAARKYAEGRGIRITITDREIMKDIKNLVDIKLAN